MSVAAATPALADLLKFPPGDGVVISDRTWRNDFSARADAVGERIRIDGVDTRVAGVAPAWLDVEFVLGYFGATPEPARRRFSEFVLEGIGRPLTVPGTDRSGTDRTAELTP